MDQDQINEYLILYDGVVNPEWILVTGAWDDSGKWVDEETWRDA